MFKYLMAAFRSMSRIFKRKTPSKAPASPAVQSQVVADPAPANSVDDALTALLGPTMAASIAPTVSQPAATKPVPVPTVEELLGYQPESAPTEMPVAAPVRGIEDHIGRTVDITALLRDIDRIFPHIPVKPTSCMQEIQFNAGQRNLADWIRQQYLTRGRQAGSLSSPRSI